MSRSPPETSSNPEINEATPLLQDEASAVDANVYVIGVESGVADESISQPQNVINNIVGTVLSAWLRFPPRMSGEPDREDSEVLSPRTLHAVSTSLRQIKAEGHFLPEKKVIAQGLVKSMGDNTYQLQLMEPDGDVIKGASTAQVSEIVAKCLQQIHEGIKEDDARKKARKERERQKDSTVIGGASGFADESISKPQTDIDKIVETLFSAWLRFPPRFLGVPIREDSEIISPRALQAMSTAWRQIKSERLFLPESEVIVQGLVESIVDYMYQLQLMDSDGDGNVIRRASTTQVSEIVTKCWQQILDGIEEEDAQKRARKKKERQKDSAVIGGASGFVDESVSEPQTDIDKIVDTLFSAWLRFPPRLSGELNREDCEFINPSALHAMSTAWRQIKAERHLLPESEVIVQGLVECMVNYVYRLQLIELGGDGNVNIEVSTAHISEVVTKCWQQILDGIEKEDARQKARKKRERRKDSTVIGGASGFADEYISEPQTDIDKIVETLFLAWLQFPSRKSCEPDSEDSEIIGSKAFHAMSAAWRQIKAERHFLPESEVIVQGLVESIVDYMYRLQLIEPDGDGNVNIGASTAHVSEIVTICWQQILDGIEKEDAREKARKKRERRRRICERLERQREIGEILWFYEPFAERTPERFSCRVTCVGICLTCSTFRMQVIISTLILAWSLSIGIMGGLYMTQCSMSYLMPYMMIAIGVAGTIALLMRVSFAAYERYNEFREEIRTLWLWIPLKFFELALLIFLIIQLSCFFSKTPSFDAGSPEYCNETFYNFVRWINYVSIAIASLWLFVYFIKLILTWQLRKYALRPW